MYLVGYLLLAMMATGAVGIALYWAAQAIEWADRAWKRRRVDDPDNL